MFLVYLLLLIGLGGGYGEGLTNTPTFLLLAGLVMILLIKEVKRLKRKEKNNANNG